MSRADLEALIPRGQVETLPGEFAPFVPTREVERLSRASRTEGDGSQRTLALALSANET